MANNAEIQKLKNEYPEFFEQFSSELLEFVFSEKTSSKIAQICSENGIEDEEKVEKIAYRVGLVLLNQVPKENFTEILEKGATLNRQTAERISTEINRSIFSQIPEILKTAEPTLPASPSPEVKPEVEPPLEAKPEAEPKETRRDIYREPME